MMLVTGITGLTGRFLYREWRQAPQAPRARYLVRPTSDVTWMHPGEEIAYGDLRTGQDLTTAMTGVDSVLHVAPRHCLPTLLDLCRRAGVRRFFFVSSAGVFSKFKSSAHTDIRNEQLLKDSGLAYTIIRPTMIYGNVQDGNIKYLVRLMNKLPVFPVLGRGDGLMQPIYAGDLARVILQAVLREENTRQKEYNVAGKRPVPYRELLRLIAGALGKQRFFLHIPYTLALLAGRIGDRFPNRLIDHEKVLRLVEDKNIDYSAAARDLGFDPMPFAEGIQLEIAALRRAALV